MSDVIKEALYESAMTVFETSAFMDVFEWEEDSGLPMPDIAATMKFAGHAEGEISLSLFSELLDTLAENMLGEPVEGPNAEKQRQDALKEALNMVCGNFLTSWMGDAPVFNLSPPEIIDIRRVAENAEAAGRIVLRLNLEDTCAELVVTKHIK